MGKRVKHHFRHHDPRLGCGYHGFCAFIAKLTSLAPMLAIVTYGDRSCSLYHVEEGELHSLCQYFHDLVNADLVTGKVRITTIFT